MNVNTSPISASVNMPVCTSTEDIQLTIDDDVHLQKLRSYIIHGLPYKKDKLEHSRTYYWSIRSGLTMIYDITKNENRIIIQFIKIL